MAPQRANNAAANEPWLALRSKHQEELHRFQQEVEKSKAELAQKIQAARVKLRDKHKREEEKFWTGKNGRTTAATAQNTSGSSAPSTMPSAVQSAPKKAQQQPPKTSSTSAKAPQPIKPGQSRPALKNPPQSRPTQKKKTTIEVIDLVSDHEDDVPLIQKEASANGAAQVGQTPASTQTHETTTASSEAQKPSNTVSAASNLQSETPTFTIPSASLELFGGKPKSYYATPELSCVKREDAFVPGEISYKGSAPSPSPSEKQLAVVNTPSRECAPSPNQKQLTVNTNYDNSSSATNLPRAFTAAPQKTSNIFLWQPSSSHPLVYEEYNGTSVQQPTFQAQQAPDTAASPAQTTLIRDSSTFTGFASWASSQRASTAAPQSQQNADQNLSTTARGSSSQVSNSAASLDSSHKQCAQDGLQKYPALATESPTNSNIFFFADNRKAAAGDDEDVPMQEAPQTPEVVRSNSAASEPVSSQQHTPRLSHIRLPTDHELRRPVSRGRASHIPSPPASLVSASEPKTPKTGKTDFKRPNLPASASKVMNARHIRAGSNASSCTIPAPITPRSQGCASVTSTSSTRKRKIEIDFSSDEESDFAPASSSSSDYDDDNNVDDDELDSPEDKQRERKKTKKSQAPAPKRWKPAPSAMTKARGSVPFPALSVPLGKGKNRMEFKPVGNTNANHRRANIVLSSSSMTPKPAPTDPTTTSAAAFTTAASKTKPNTSTPRFPTPSPSSTTLLRFTPRKAALQATEKIHKLRAADEEFWTHESIVEVEEQEERVKTCGESLKAAERVRRGLRGLSITPGPGSSATDGHEEDRVEDLMHVESESDSSVASGIGGVRNEPGGGSASASASRTNTSGLAWSKWTHDRNHGDRFLSKSQPQTQSHPREYHAATVEDATSDADLDISTEYDLSRDTWWKSRC